MQRLTEYLGEFIAYRRRWAWALIVVVTVASALGWSGYRLCERTRHPEPQTEEMNALIKAYEAFHFGDYRYVLAIESVSWNNSARVFAKPVE